MKKYILKRDEFVVEMYSNKSENDYEELNEGLLTNLFGALFKRDMWASVNGNESIKREFKEIDDKLNGFYLAKVANPNDSQNVRQTLVDWANDIYKAKIKKLKGIEELDKSSKEYSDKLLSVMSVGCMDEKEIEKIYSDETFLKKIEKIKKSKSKEIEKLNDEVKKIDDKYQKELDDFTGSSVNLKRWADILKSRMNDILDKILAGKYDEENILGKDLEKLQKEKDEKMKKKNNEELKKQNDQLKQVEQERNTVLKKCGAEITTERTGKGFLTKVANGLKFSNKLFEEVSIFDGKSKVNLDEFNNSGLEKLLGINVKKVAKNNTSLQLFNTLKNLNDIVLSNIYNDFKKTIKNVNGSSMQAFLVSYSNLILSCLSNDRKIEDDLKLCMARCAIYNNTLVGFGLPCPDNQENEKDEDKRSMFSYYVNKTLEEWNKDNKLKKQSQKLDDLCKEIIEKSKKLIEDNNKKQEQEVKQ